MLIRTPWLFVQRQHTILNSLVKLRAQHGREGGVSSVNYPRALTLAEGLSAGPRTTSRGDNSSSTGSSGSKGGPSVDASSSPLKSLIEGKGVASPHSLLSHELIHVEAQKLLEKLSRQQESFTDVPPDSPIYCVEVGKLLAVSAHFGCLTTTARVTEVLNWVEQKGPKSLTTLRQIMSIATPILNLADGKVAGVKFFWLSLYPLVEKCLLLLIRTPPEELSYEERLHSRGAIISVFQFIYNSLGAPKESNEEEKSKHILQGSRLNTSGSVEHPQQIISLLQLSTRALSAIAVNTTTRKNKSAEVLMELPECVAALSAIFALEQHISPLRKNTESMKEAQGTFETDTAISNLYSTWMKHLHVVSLSFTRQTGNIKPMFVQQLSQIALAVPKENLSLQLLPYVLQFLPSAFSYSSVKELCGLTQLVNKLHMKFGSALLTPAAVQKSMEACRPKIVLLAESTAFRHVESSILMGNLSRWEEFADGGPIQEKASVEGGSVEHYTDNNWPFILSNDLLDLLCNRFVARLDLVLMYHMIPFLQGLCRIEAYRQNCRSTCHPKKQHILLREVRLEPYLEQCVERVIALSREKKCNAYEAGSAVKAFVELGMDAQRLFLSVEDILCSSLTESCSNDRCGKLMDATDVLKGTEQTGTSPSEISGSRLTLSYLPVVKAVELFAREMPQVTVEQKQTFVVAQRILRKLHQKAPQYLSQISSPGELISLFTTLVGDPSKKGVEEEDFADVESQDKKEVASSNNKVRNAEAIESFLLQVDKVGNACNISELATLSLGVAQISVFYPSLSTSAMGTLMIRLKEICQAVSVPPSELKKIMDACCKMNYSQTASFLSKMMITSLTTSACRDVSSSFLDPKAVFSFHSLSLASKSTEHFCAVMPLSRQEIVSLTQAIFSRVQEQLIQFQEYFPASMKGRSQAISELSYLGFCLSRLCIKTTSDSMKEEHDGEEDTGKALHRTSGEEDCEEGVEEKTFFCSVHSSSENVVLEKAVTRVFELLGDVLEGLLNNKEVEEDESSEGNATSNLLEGEVEPRKLVMIIQAFDNAKVVHSSLMYGLLYQLQLVAHRLDPLELSLVMNASLRQGAWNARVMKRLASEVESKILRSPLRQCQTILFSLERSNFISPGTYLLPIENKRLTAGVLTQPKSVSALETLTRVILQRMVDLCRTRENLEGLFKKENFGDIIGGVRALAFFHHPPHPVLDIYYLVATTRLVKYCIRLCQKKNGVPLTSNEMQQTGLAALHLLQNVFQLRKVKYQRVVSLAVQRALLMLEENCRRVAGYQHRHGGKPLSSAPTTVERSHDCWSTLSAKDLAELLKTLQEQQLFYTRKKREHRRRINQLYGRLLSAFSQKMVSLSSSFLLPTASSTIRQMYYALLPLCSPGHLFDIPPILFLKKKNSFSLYEILTPDSPAFERLIPVYASALLYGLSFCHSKENTSYANGFKKLQEIFHYLNAKLELPLAEAIVALRCVAVLQLPEHEGLMNRIAEVVLPAQRLSLGNAVDALLALAMRKRSNNWGAPLDSLAVQIMHVICSGFSRRESSGPASEKKKLVQIYRLLTMGDGLIIAAFLEADNVDSSTKQAGIQLVSQAVCVTAKTYYESQKSSSLSLSTHQLRHISDCVQGANRSKNSGALPSHIYEVCEVWK